MLLKFNLHKAVGVTSLIQENGICIALWLMIPEEERKEAIKLLSEPKSYPLKHNESSEGSINCSNMNIENEIHHPKIRAKALFMVNNIASAKTGNILKQYFLIKKKDKNGDYKDESEMIQEIKNKFFNENMKALPIPLEKSWEDHFWEEVEKNLSRLPEKGNPPMAGFVMSLPDINFLSRLIEKCHAKSEFIQYKKRAPKVDALLAIGDIKGFDAQGWAKDFVPNVLKDSEKLNTYPFEQQETIVRGFELFGSTPLILSNLNTLHAAGIRAISITIRLMKDEGKKKQYKTALRKILEEFDGKHSDLVSILNNFDDLFAEHQQNIKNGNWKAIQRYLATIVYDNVADGCRELAITCGRFSVSKASYPKYEEAYLTHIQNCLTAPKEYPTISGKLKDSKISWEVIDMSDPRAWVVGIETYCCQHLDSVGGACVRYAAANPSTSGIFRVEEKGKTIAQSFIWLAPSSKKDEYILVLDNIEVAGENIRENVLNAYRDFVKELEKYSALFRIRNVTIGIGYTESFLLKLAPEKASGENYANIPASLNYSDAHTQKLFKKFPSLPPMRGGK